MAIQLPALDIQPPQQQPGALDNFAKVSQLKNLLGQQQLQQQAITEGAQQIKDQQATTAAMHAWDGKSLDDLPGLMLKNGASSTAVLKAKSQILDQKQKLSDVAKNDAETGTKNFALQQSKNDAQLGILQSATSVPDAQLHQSVASVLPQALQNGIIDQQHAQGIQQMLQSTPDPTALRQQLGLLEKGLMGGKEQFEQIQKQQETQAKVSEAASRAQTAQTSGQRLQAEMPGGAMQPVEQKELSDYMAKNPGKGPVDFAKFKAGIAPAIRNYYANTGGGMIPGAGGATGGSAGSGQSAAPAAPDISKVPQQIRGTVKEIIDYRGAMPPMGRNTPQNQAIRYWVNALAPDYDETSFPARNKIVQSYTSGKESKSINAINTALGHLGELGTAAQALSQNDIPLLHSIASKVGAAEGGTAETTYQSILHRVSPEMTAAYVQGGGGEGERGANEGDFALNKGAKQITANVAESAKLLRSKISAQENQWNSTFRPTREADQFQNRFITPAAKATLDKFSSQAPTSGNHPFFSQFGGAAKP